MASTYQNNNAPSEDDPNALSEHGFIEDEHYLDEVRPPAQAQKVGPIGGIARMYGQYWQKNGTASASELFWGLGFLLLGTVLLYGTSIYMHGFINNETTSGLVRTLYMLGIIVNTLWIIVSIVPALSLIRRFRNNSVQS